jgi:trans-2,3-dihydro-3-hydroxyanthranilate isomerase
MSAELAYRVVDVFTDCAYAGNPLAVVLDGDDLTTEQMQSIAREFNLSETTFPLSRTADEASYRLRIFTPSTELPFAGHPSIGSAWVMRDIGRVVDGRLIQECGAGLLPVDLAGDGATLTGGTPYLREAVDAVETLAAIGLTAGDLAGDPLQWAGCGLSFGFLHVVPDAVARVEVDINRLGMIDGIEGGVSVFSVADGVAHTRVFAGGVGIAEDPATGSAGLGLGVWLVATGHAGADGETGYVIEQGIEMGRPSRLECVVRAEAGVAVECRVTGSVVPVAEGRIRIP